MTRLLPLVLILLCSGVMAQKSPASLQQHHFEKTAVKPKHFKIVEPQQLSEQKKPAKPVQQTTKATYNEMIIGNTQYDLQSNSSVQNRVFRSGDNISATWTQSWQTSPFADRGTGYNTSADDGLVWNDIPLERVEAIRTGWSSIVETGDGRQVIICHEFPLQLYMAYKDPGDSDWTESYIDTNVPEGVSWASVAAGGANGNSIHMFYLTMPGANQSTVPTLTYEGMDGALLYSRSTDQGDTWDMHEVILEGMDSTQFLGFRADAYAIHARGDKVAFAVFNDFGDSFIMISEDNGDTWDKRILIDFPVDLYTGDDEIIDLDEDELADTLYNSDNSGAVFIDQSGMTHVTYGHMRYLDDVLADDQWTYFPFTDGLAYWNEDMDDNSWEDIAFAEDVDDSGVLEFSDDIGTYFMSLTGMPQFAQDSNGDLFISYSGVVESHTTGAQNFRHLYFMKSEDGGESWSTPVDGTPDEEFIGYEHVFACMAPDVDDKLHIVYQRDQEPGLHVRGDLDPVDLNDIVYLWVTTDLNFEVGINEISLDVNVYPNPVENQLWIETDTRMIGYSIMDQSGRLVAQTNSILERGPVDVSFLSAGTYFLSIQTESGQQFAQFVKK